MYRIFVSIFCQLAALGSASALAAGDSRPGPRGFTEPVVLSSANGVLEVTLTTHQGSLSLDSVTAPVRNALVFGYAVIRGGASNGKTVGDNLYPAPTLNVYPGQTLVIHVANDMGKLSIADFSNPAFTPRGSKVPLYPAQLTSTPINNHVHGLHVSPAGNSDNVLLNIPPGFTNTYTYRIPADHPEGMYWYHSHRHMLTAAETYRGLAGLLVIGRADGNIPLVTQNNIPIRNMAIQYNYVFDRAGGLSQLNNTNWPADVSTRRKPTESELKDGTYEPKLTPVNFNESAIGKRYFTARWFGKLSPNNNRGIFQFMPSNLQSFRSGVGQPSVDVAADLSLPDRQRDLQYTVNGQFQPILRSKPGQTEVWVLANISDFAYVRVALTETATNSHSRIAVLGQDGNPYPDVHYPTTDGGASLLIPPASRFVIAVTMPKTGGLVLEMPRFSGTVPQTSNEGILYSNTGTPNSPAVLGTVSIDPYVVSYVDGFFTYPTQVLATVQPAAGQGNTTRFVAGQALNAYTSFVDLRGVIPDVERKLFIGGGFANNHANAQDPNAFAYQFDNNQFPNIPLIQPRLNTVEQWTYINNNNDQHPIHIHVNDFQVQRIVDPVSGIRSGYQMWGQDNVNVPSPLQQGSHTTPAVMSLRTEFQAFTGAYVTHCHRLNHEDNGLMAIINVIPEVSTYAVGAGGSPGTAARVRIYDGVDDRLITTVVPFPRFEGALSVAMGDVNGDQILDLIIGAGPGGDPDVKAYSGQDEHGKGPFHRELYSFRAFGPNFAGGVNVAAADIDGNGLVDNIIVGSGPGMETQVRVYGSERPAGTGAAPKLFTRFSPYPGFDGGVNLAAGMIDGMSGRFSIVTAPGPGAEPRVMTFLFDLYTRNGAPAPTTEPTPRTTSNFLAFDPGYRNGVSVATGWVAGKEGGFQRIIVGTMAGASQVRVFSSGSALDGHPEMYLDSPDDYDVHVSFQQVASFNAFSNAPWSGVRVATTSTVQGADLLVSGLTDGGNRSQVRKYGLVRQTPKAIELSPVLLDQVGSWPGGQIATIGGV